jgi:hypothetical protein
MNGHLELFLETSTGNKSEIKTLRTRWAGAGALPPPHHRPRLSDRGSLQSHPELRVCMQLPRRQSTQAQTWMVACAGQLMPHPSPLARCVADHPFESGERKPSALRLLQPLLRIVRPGTVHAGRLASNTAERGKVIPVMNHDPLRKMRVHRVKARPFRFLKCMERTWFQGSLG